jgi:hypothetical protein
MLPAAPPSSRRPSEHFRFSAKRCWTEALGVYGLFFFVGVLAAAFTEAGLSLNNDSLGRADSILQGVQELAEAAIAIVVVAALTRLRGLTFADIGWSPQWGKRAAYRWQALGIGVIFAISLVLSAVLLNAVSPDAHYPFAPPSAWHLLYEIPAAINAGIIEELVVVALFVTALEQARTPVWIIYVVGITIRLSYHIYYGPGVIMFVLWATAAIWLFRRTRRITPLIVVHAIYDTVGSITNEVRSIPLGVFDIISLALFGLAILVLVRALVIAGRGRPAPFRPAAAIPVASIER